jgi:hypothetical protein
MDTETFLVKREALQESLEARRFRIEVAKTEGPTLWGFPLKAGLGLLVTPLLGSFTSQWLGRLVWAAAVPLAVRLFRKHRWGKTLQKGFSFLENLASEVHFSHK